MRVQAVVVTALFLVSGVSSSECTGNWCTTYNRRSVRAMSRLNGFVFATTSATEHLTCLERCMMDCRCLSVNVRRSLNQCELSWQDEGTAGRQAGAHEDFDYMDVRMDHQSSTRRANVSATVDVS